MQIHQDVRPWRSSRGNALAVVLMLCAALLILSTAFFHSMASNRRISNRAELLMQAREGAEATLGFASAEFNKRATSLSSISDDPLSGYSLSTAEKNYLSGTSADNNIIASSLEIKAGKISATKTDMILLETDPAYTGDQSAGLNMAVRSGYIYAKSATADPGSGLVHTAHVAGVVQVREQTWLNYGMFYNMDMEFYPGKDMDVKGAVHTNADMYLSATGGTGTELNFHKKVTAAGHVYRGLKYTISAFNDTGTADEGTPKGFTGVTGFPSAEGTGKVYISKDGTTGGLVEMTGDKDSLGSKTKPSANKATWVDLQTSTWKKYVMDSSLSVEKFTPPGLPLYVPENLTTAAVERRNHAYAMIEPQLPATDTTRYYGRKSDAVENLKFSALAGMTIVVDDLDEVTDGALNASKNGYAIPWKLVWYEGEVLANQPTSKENLPARDATTKLPIPHVIDPFALNDEVDRTEALIANDSLIKMKRNLKALLRDAIVVVPYRDSGAGANTFGTGTTGVTITSYPATAAAASFAMTTANKPTGGWTRTNQKAGAWPVLNEADTATYNRILYGQAAALYNADSIDRYPDYGNVTGASSRGNPNGAANAYSGHYDRRQGHTRIASTDTYNNGLRGAQHVVYIDLQKLNWIINTPELWKHPITGAAIYDFDKSFTNLIYVDLPSQAKDTTRFALSESDKVVPAARPTATKPGYAVFLNKGARLPRLSYNESTRTPGFTLATNGPLYIMGNFNADGISGTGDSILPDSTNWYSSSYPLANEIPAMVAADAVTFLTEKYSLKNSNKGKVSSTADTTKAENGDNGANHADGAQFYRYNGYNGDTTQTTTAFQEVSTAIICGLVPTIPYIYTQSPYNHPTVTYSGSVNNLPRFLEYMGLTVRYRGSMAALFESEVNDAAFYEGPHSYWFAPPTRDWGYHQYFAAGKYPPGTPVLRTTRLIAVRDITAAEYATGPSQPP